MSVTTGAKLLDILKSMVATDLDATATAFVASALGTRILRCDRIVDAAASTTSNVTLENSTLVPLLVTAVKFVPGAALTAANATCAVLTLVYNNGNGGSDTTIATVNTAAVAGGGTGDWTAEIGQALTITAANAVVPVGSQVQFKVTKTSTGTVVPMGSLFVKASLA